MAPLSPEAAFTQAGSDGRKVSRRTSQHRPGVDGSHWQELEAELAQRWGARRLRRASRREDAQDGDEIPADDRGDQETENDGR
jgi:hypothetical protein